MNLERIKELIDLVANSPIAELEVEEDGRKVRIVRGACIAQLAHTERITGTKASTHIVAAEEQPNPGPSTGPRGLVIVHAPLFGVFHLSPAPGAPPFVEVGVSVVAGQTLCLIEAMKVFNTVTARATGRIAEVFAENNQEVAQGQILFRLE